MFKHQFDINLNTAVLELKNFSSMIMGEYIGHELGPCKIMKTNCVEITYLISC